MKTWYSLGALAAMAGAIQAQQPSRATGRRVEGDSLVLSRSSAIARALQTNPQLEVARQQLLQSRARKVTALKLPDPALTTSYEDQPGPLQFGKAGAKNVGIEFGVPFPDKLRLQGSIASADIRSSDFRFTQAKQQVAADASRAYDALLASRRRARDLAEGRALADSVVQKAQVRFNAGTVARLDVIKARVDLAQADNDLIANSREIVAAEAALNRLLGTALGTRLMQADSLEVPLDVPPLVDLEAAALVSRPDLGDLTAQREGARANTHLLKEYWLPDFVLGATRDYAQSGSPGYTAGFGISLPLFFWQHTRGDVAESQHRELELAAAFDDARAAVGQGVREAFATAESALRQAIFIRDELLPSAREAFRVASVAYTLGGASALEVLDARRTLLDAQMQYSDALANANSARSDLELAVGRPLDSFRPGGSRE
ncbi:MAG: TolC family protein [Gemmatimonadaceae bacterium]